jgi:hypothetical protein
LSALKSCSNTVCPSFSVYIKVDPDYSVKNIHGFTPMEMVLNNDRERTLVYIMNKEQVDLWEIPSPLDLRKTLFADDFKPLKILIDNNSIRCLTVILTKMISSINSDELLIEFKGRIIEYFVKEGFLRALILNH